MSKVIRVPHATWGPRCVPELWGHDHISTLLYVETRIVDHFGKPSYEHMRCNAERHPFYTHRGSGGAFEHHTRLVDGSVAESHDDWDCVDDFERAQLVMLEGTGASPAWKFTDLGWRLAHLVRRARAERTLNAAATTLREEARKAWRP